MDQMVLMCSECTEERKAKTQENIDEKISKLLKDKIEKIWFKIKLTSEELNEHVWINVIDINLKDRTFCGNIDNDIYFVSDKYTYGDQVIAGFDKIEEILKSK